MASRAYTYFNCSPCGQRGLAIDGYCMHDDVDLDTNEDYHVIKCNQCSRWWQCYGESVGMWSAFIKYNRMDGSEPATVNVVCSPKAWATTDYKA